MKNLTLQLAIILFSINGFSQNKNLKDDPRATLHFFITDFEGNNSYLNCTDTINPWVIDTINAENIWQIGKPNKVFFDSAHNVPNCIVTDTIKPYPINNHSTFEFNVKKPIGMEYRGWSSVSLYFDHKYDTDSLYDGGYIDVSYDGGNSFTNIIYDNINGAETYSSHFYKNDDTICGGIPAFTGKSDGWAYTQLVIAWPYEHWDKTDSMIIRFNFKSDSVNNNKEGWLIDNIYFLLEDRTGIGVNENGGDNTLTFYPNPVNDLLTIELKNHEINLVKIFSLTGQLLLSKKINYANPTINTANLTGGIYLIKVIYKNNKTYTAKIIKQ